jgi:methanethiol S-methyltransferase
MKKERNTTRHLGTYRESESRCAMTLAVLILIASHLLGAISLVLWARFLSRGALGLVDLGLGWVGAVLFDLLLSLIFFVQHSIMVRASFKGWMARWVGRDYYGAIYAMASGVALLVLTIFWQGPVHTYLVFGGLSRLLLGLVSTLSLVGFIWGVRSLDTFDMLGSGPILRSLRRQAPSEPMPLTIRGPYRWVRHPLYFFCLTAIWAVTEISADRLLYNIMWTVWIVIATMLEERDLITAFGAVYRDYCVKVPMLIPWHVRPTQWSPPAYVARSVGESKLGSERKSKELKKGPQNNAYRGLRPREQAWMEVGYGNKHL